MRILLAATTLVVLCDFASAHITQAHPGNAAANSASSSRFLRSYESIHGAEERSIGSVLKQLTGLEKKMNDFRKKDLMRALGDKKFRVDLLKSWSENQYTVGHVQGKLKVDPFHPRYKQLLLDYMNIYIKSPASPASLTRRKKADVKPVKKVRFG
ncbi:hypothetical protein PHYSODRAFT_286802 [Phytophthora sojae]|uniref:RxLR effector protein n=2 Tax=Phytophthora sojae TaxID=67593 RepID=G4ZVZ4_PHYSP|nr:hypothetical protein PHYSODRAFT_286802 [Phytophthora sojae]AEK81153.1 Avh316 [Phytophthora sojae]AEK81154.1 Avh316 [Phytophthora sojae]AEK81155.1 Avh316 [Phytophthora sojae]EGZ11574.1 hypothetical protein PHYSODRAFT_286802 [Phytophthora sojae]|eukprot:XP_009531907.1 hypothetical protein PHYSODRAFT_286802 [Phytophthora sojae]